MKKILLSAAILATLFAGCKKDEDKKTETPAVEFLASTTPSNRVAVLEDFTGVRCGYCPDGHVRAKAVLDANPGKFIIIATHAGSYATPQSGWANFTTVQGNAILAQAQIPGFPGGTTNRMTAASLGVNQMTNGGPLAMDRGQWSPAATKVMTLSAPVNLGAKATFDPVTRVLTVKVDMYYTAGETGENRLNVALLQDKLLAKQSNYTAGAANPTPDYEQNHVLRDMISGGNFGDVITESTATGSKISKTYTYNVPLDYHGTDVNGGGAVVVDNLKVVAYVTRGQLEIINATEVDVK